MDSMEDSTNSPVKYPEYFDKIVNWLAYVIMILFIIMHAYLSSGQHDLLAVLIAFPIISLLVMILLRNKSLRIRAPVFLILIILNSLSYTWISPIFVSI